MRDEGDEPYSFSKSDSALRQARYTQKHKEDFQKGMDDRHFEAFVEWVRLRMEAGAHTYGDASIDKSLDDLIGEIQAELEDIAGWASILWAKVEKLREGVVSTIGKRLQDTSAEDKGS